MTKKESMKKPMNEIGETNMKIFQPGKWTNFEKSNYYEIKEWKEIEKINSQSNKKKREWK